jgi:PAS domain-containing protein
LTGDPPLPAKDFEKLLAEAIDESLSSLGENMKLKVYLHLEERFGVHKSEVAFRLASFAQAVDELFGLEAGDLEAHVLKRIYEEIGRKAERSPHSGLTFVEQVKLARNQLYTEFVSKMQSAVAVFYLENPADLRSFRLIALNSAAAKLIGVTVENVLGKTLAELYPETSNIEVQKTLQEILRYGKPKELGEFHYSGGSGTQRFSVAAFVLSSNCVGLVFKNAVDAKPTAAETHVVQEQAGNVENEIGGWRWDLEVVDNQLFFDKSRARKQWAKQKLSGGSRTAEFFSTRGKEYFEDGDFSRARDFFLKAAELFERKGRVEEAFENSSLRVSAYIREEKVRLSEFFVAAEAYFKKYPEFFMHEAFVKNLAYYNQWRGYQREQDRNFNDSRKSYSEAEELFLTLKQRKDAVFNASKFVLTYISEGRLQEFAESAKVFLRKYAESWENKHYKEVLAHHCSYGAEKADDVAEAMGLRRQAEKLFLEIEQRTLAYKNACGLLELCWTSLVPEDGSSVKKCFEETEKFFDRYPDFSENEFYRKKLAEYYLFQARALASQLKQALH